MTETPFGKPEGLFCEAMVPVKNTGMRTHCHHPARYIYGPECEAQSGKLMYLCAGHGAQIREWRVSHLYDPVDCPTHGTIGIVKDYLVLKDI